MLSRGQRPSKQARTPGGTLDGTLAAFGSQTYTWNDRNQLSATSAGSASFSYDGLGRCPDTRPQAPPLFGRDQTRLAAALSRKAPEDLQKTDLLRADAATPVGRTVGSRVIRSAPGSFLLEGATMANKDKGGSKSSKTAASKSLKEKRQAKKAKAARSGSSSWETSTNK